MISTAACTTDPVLESGEEEFGTLLPGLQKRWEADILSIALQLQAPKPDNLGNIYKNRGALRNCRRRERVLKDILRDLRPPLLSRTEALPAGTREVWEARKVYTHLSAREYHKLAFLFHLLGALHWTNRIRSCHAGLDTTQATYIPYFEIKSRQNAVGALRHDALCRGYPINPELESDEELAASVLRAWQEMQKAQRGLPLVDRRAGFGWKLHPNQEYPSLQPSFGV